jgi:hypothetical protein
MTEYLRDLYAPAKQGSMSVFDQQINVSEGDAKYYRDRKEGALGELRQAIRSGGLAGLRRKDWVVDIMLQRLRDSEEQYCKAVAERCVLETAKKVAEAVVDDLGRRRKPLEAFSAALASAAQALYASHESILNFGEAVLLIRFFDRATDWDKFYRLDADEYGQLREVDAAAEYHHFLTHGVPQPATGSATLWDLVDLFNRKGERELRRRLQTHTEERFWKDFEANPREIDVLAHPKLTEKWENTIEKLVRAATPLARRERVLGGKNVAVRKLAYLGVPKLDGAPYDGFIEDVRNQLVAKMGVGQNEVTIQPTGKPWEVYLYIVTYAFPLSSLTVVTKECHDAYQSFYRALLEQRIAETKHQIPLHLSRTWEGKFEDLRVYVDKTAEEITVSREVLLFGALLRVFEVSDAQGRVEYEYNSGPPHWRQRKLGTRREAVDFLQSNAELRDNFKAAVTGREQILAGTKERLGVYYWALQYLNKSGAVQAGSAEATLVGRRVNQTYQRLVKLGATEEELDVQRLAAGTLSEGESAPADLGAKDEAPDVARAKAEEKARQLTADLIKAKIKDSVEWKCGLPVLKDVEKWSPSGPAAG